MRVKYGRNVAMAVFLAAIVIVLATSFFMTPLTISDSDPSTYVVVPLLMLPLFALFTIKANPIPKVSRKDIAAGSALFALFIVTTLALRFALSFEFISYRIDLLLLPIAIAALAALTFGLENVPKFKGILLYSLLASPAVLMPVLSLYSAFTTFNAQIIFQIMKPFVAGAIYAAPGTISANGYNIGIGQACVSIGIFIALALFVIPLAYLYDGKATRKILWVFGALALLFLLNVFRMLGVAYVWLTYGPNVTVAFIHEFIGAFLFYIVIIVMSLAAGKFGLSLGLYSPKSKNAAARQRKSPGAAASKYAVLAVALALLFPLAYAYETAGYSTAINVSPIALSSRVTFNYSTPEIARQVGALTDGQNFSSMALASADGRYVVFSLSNSTVNAMTPLILLATAPSPSIVGNFKKNNTVLGELSFLDSNGIEETVTSLRSNGTEFFIYSADMPLLFPNVSSTVAGIYVIMQDGMLHNATCGSNYNPFENAFPNAEAALLYNATLRLRISQALCISHRLVWSNAI